MSIVAKANEKYDVQPKEADAIITQRVDKKTGTKKWALVSKKSKRVLKWFNKKPSPEAVQKEERRVQFFKHKG